MTDPVEIVARGMCNMLSVDPEMRVRLQPDGVVGPAWKTFHGWAHDVWVDLEKAGHVSKTGAD